MNPEIFPPIDAPTSLQATFDAVRSQFGFVPDAVARLAHAPGVSTYLLQGFAAFERTSLPALARETVIMTVARSNGCAICLALHAAKLQKLGAPTTMIDALHDGTALQDASLDAVRALTLQALVTAGDVGSESLTRFLDAGYTREQALEVMQGIGIYTLSTFANRLTGAVVDDAFAPFAREGALRS